MLVVNVPTSNHAKSTDLYAAIACEKNEAFSDDATASMVWSDEVTFLLMTREKFATFSAVHSYGGRDEDRLASSGRDFQAGRVKESRFSHSLLVNKTAMLNFLKRPCSLRGLALSFGLLCLSGVSASAEDLVIVGARIYQSPDAPALIDATLVTRDGVIVAVGPSGQVEVDPSARVIAGEDLVVVAGLWNSHVHLLLPSMAVPPEENAEALSDELEGMLTRWGFTTVFDIGSLPGAAIDLRRRIERGEVHGPNILTVDAPFFPNEGTQSTCVISWQACPPWRSGHRTRLPDVRGGNWRVARMA
jgi:hypothetical protein